MGHDRDEAKVLPGLTCRPEAVVRAVRQPVARRTALVDFTKGSGARRADRHQVRLVSRVGRRLPSV